MRYGREAVAEGVDGAPEGEVGLHFGLLARMSAVRVAEIESREEMRSTVRSKADDSCRGVTRLISYVVP